MGSVPIDAGSVLLEGESGRGDLGDERNEEYCRPRDMFLVLDVLFFGFAARCAEMLCFSESVVKELAAMPPFFQRKKPAA